MIARYSVRNESKLLLASKYMLFLPTVEELQREIAKERRLIEILVVVASIEDGWDPYLKRSDPIYRSAILATTHLGSLRFKGDQTAHQ